MTPRQFTMTMFLCLFCFVLGTAFSILFRFLPPVGTSNGDYYYNDSFNEVRSHCIYPEPSDSAELKKLKCQTAWEMLNRSEQRELALRKIQTK